MKTESFYALLAGTAIGVAIGVLFAPEKGSELRRKLKDKAETEGGNLKKAAKGKILDELERIERLLNEDDVNAETEEA